MDIYKATDVELKAHVYDCSQMIQQLQAEINECNTELERRRMVAQREAKDGT
jgi:hypothetical protein